MADKTWRDVCRPIIARVLKYYRNQDEKVIRQALFKAYPFGQRKYHPYKIWLDEIKVQRGAKRKAKKIETQDPNQMELL